MIEIDGPPVAAFGNYVYEKYSASGATPFKALDRLDEKLAMLVAEAGASGKEYLVWRKRPFLVNDGREFLAGCRLVFIGKMDDDEISMPDLDDACLSYRHDYGLMSPAEQVKLKHEGLAWFNVWSERLAETLLNECD